MSTVMSFGDGIQGALGLPDSETGPGGDVYEPTRVPGLPSDIVSISAGHYHSLAIDSRGGLWAWGRNQEAQLGRDPLAPRDSWNDPKRVERLDHVNVCAAFASAVISAAIGDDGSVWAWGKSKRRQLGLGKGITEAVVPCRVEALAGEKIVKVSFGWGHACAQTEDESCWAGVIQPMFCADSCVIVHMEMLARIFVNFECLISGNGTLLSSGSNVHGQVGRVKLDLGLLPVVLSVHPVSVASGLGHSLAICEVTLSDVEGGGMSIFSWGWNQCSQLGREGPEGWEGEAPVSVSGGRVHSIALTSKGQVWVWGCSKNGCLGLGSSSDEVEPTLLDYLEDFEVLQAVSGFDHNLILIAE
ncbi:hypothetical protein CRYUN_Cryun01aG0134900 [Craigia yunnanensis]